MMGFVVAIHLITQLQTEEHYFKEELETPFRAKFGNFILSGKVNRDGIFIPDVNQPPISANNYKSSSVGGLRHLWHPPYGARKVYELRYGMLIPMTVGNGCFIPEEGAKIIRFEDYRYSVFARPIYNLPGSWVKKGTVFDTDPDESPPKKLSFKSGK
jgi:hypothetical protein